MNSCIFEQLHGLRMTFCVIGRVSQISACGAQGTMGTHRSRQYLCLALEIIGHHLSAAQDDHLK